jgi:hypothetical protein
LFGGIEIDTKDPANVRFFQGNKQGTETVYQSKLRVVGPGQFYTVENVEFRIEKLEKPMVHDPSRRINSGSYKLQILGTGMAYVDLAAKIPYVADFAASEASMTFYGNVVKQWVKNKKARRREKINLGRLGQSIREWAL